MENTLNLKDMLGLQSMQGLQIAITALQTELSAERRSRERADESREIAMQEMQTMFQNELRAERRNRERVEEKREIAVQEMLVAKETELMAERRARERAEERELEMREMLSSMQSQRLEDSRALKIAEVKNEMENIEKHFFGVMMAGMLFDGKGLEERLKEDFRNPNQRRICYRLDDSDDSDEDSHENSHPFSHGGVFMRFRH